MQHYENFETHKIKGGGKVVRKVSIKNGKGYKSVTKYHRGRKIGTIKKPIHKNHIQLILVRRFVPGLFSDCESHFQPKGFTLRR
jgi:hypothetical protein